LRSSALNGAKMIIGTVTVTKSMLAAAAAAVSFMLSIASTFAGLGAGVRTPGRLLIDSLIYRAIYPGIGGALALSLGADWLSWFVAICLVYFVITMLRRRLRG
jgi:hypothetical protein